MKNNKLNKCKVNVAWKVLTYSSFLADKKEKIERSILGMDHYVFGGGVKNPEKIVLKNRKAEIFC